MKGFTKIIAVAMIWTFSAAGFGGYRTSPVANAAGEQPVIEDERQAVIDGKMFFVSDSFKAATRNYIFQTGSISPRVSLSIRAATTGTYATNVITLAWSESLLLTTTTGGTIGTSVTSYNANRGSTITATGSVTHSPSSISTYGTTMPGSVFNISNLVFATTHDYQFGPSWDSGWLLAPNTKYWFSVTPSSITSTIQVFFRWKE
jgi:hypothetical protein